MRLVWWVKLVLSRDLLGFYRMDVLGAMKKWWLYLGNIEIFVWRVGSDGCGGTWMLERYRLIWRIYLSWERLVRDFGVIFGAIFVEWEWKMIGKNWDFTIRWSIRWESNGVVRIIGIYWDRCIFQSVWRLTCLCCWADPGSAPGWKVPPSLIFHDF